MDFKHNFKNREICFFVYFGILKIFTSVWHFKGQKTLFFKKFPNSGFKVMFKIHFRPFWVILVKKGWVTKITVSRPPTHSLPVCDIFHKKCFFKAFLTYLHLYPSPQCSHEYPRPAQSPVLSHWCSHVFPEIQKDVIHFVEHSWGKTWTATLLVFTFFIIGAIFSLMALPRLPSLLAFPVVAKTGLRVRSENM